MAGGAPTPRRLGSVPVAVVAGVGAAVVALAVGLVGIGRSFDYDEAVTYAFFVSGGSLRKALTTQLVFNNHPPFSAVLAAVWRLGLVGETGQRLVPVTFGATTVGLVTWYAARRLGVLAGATAGALLLLNPVFVLQYRSLRGYSLATLAVVLAGLAIERSWHDARRRWLVAQALGGVVAVTTHAYSLLPLAFFAVVTLALGELRLAHVVTAGAAALVALLISLPVLDDAVRNARARGSRFLDDFPVFATRFLLGDGRLVALLTGALVVLGAAAIARTSQRHLVAVLAGSGLVVLVVLVLWFVVRPFDLYVRFFIGLLPLGAVLAARGLVVLPIWARAIVAVVVVSLLVPGARRILEAEPAIRQAAAIVDVARDQDLAVCGRDVEALVAYTDPVPAREATDRLPGCDVYIAVVRLGDERTAALRDRYGGRLRLGGGLTVWAASPVLDAISVDG